MRSVFGFSGGFGGHRKAYAAFLGAYADATERETVFFTSRRRGKPVTRLWGDPAVEVFAYQAAHLADKVRELVERSDGPVELHFGAHSFGVPVAAFFAARLAQGDLYPQEIQEKLTLASFTGLCPGAVYAEPVWKLEGRIIAMAARDVLTSKAGRTYWGGAGPYLLGNPRRSLNEGVSIARNPVVPTLMAELADAGVPTMLLLAPDDEAFSYEKTRARLPRDVWRDLPYGTRHNPQNDPSATIRAMGKYGALHI